ncbi:MAG TPA: OsmC family protein [Acidimicrobiia bacterium]|nr:OsmC family protein [Acidimicrobiia bacterium]
MATEIVSEQDLTQPIVRRKRVTVSNDGSMMAAHDYGEFGTFVTDEPIAHGGTGEGPSPLQAVLGALCGCESVTFHRTASDMGFAYEGIEFEAEFTIDIRGRMGVRGVRQHFQSVRVQAIVTTDETPERLAEVVEETEARCPVYNLLNDAGVNLEVQWVRRVSS